MPLDGRFEYFFMRKSFVWFMEIVKVAQGGKCRESALIEHSNNFRHHLMFHDIICLAPNRSSRPSVEQSKLAAA